MSGKEHDDLVEVARKWLLKPWGNGANYGHGACSLVITDMTSAARETPDVIGWSGDRSVMIECKTSVSDFKAESRKGFRRKQELGDGEHECNDETGK